MIGSATTIYPQALVPPPSLEEEEKRLRRERSALKIAPSVEQEDEPTNRRQEELKKGFQRFVDFAAKNPSSAQIAANKMTNNEKKKKSTQQQLTAKALSFYHSVADAEALRFSKGHSLNRAA